MTEQTQQLNRVVATAAEAVLDFIKTRLTDAENTGIFTADQLRFYVNNNVGGFGVSPSTADRVLRDLRAKGKLDYIVLNRGRSLYRAVPIGTTKA